MLKVKDIMTMNAVTIPQDMDVRRICSILMKNKLSGLPVVDRKGCLNGFISERDIISSVNLENFLEKKAKDIMTKKVICIKEETSVDEVSRIFIQWPFRYLPVTKRGKVVGIISRKDLINRLLGKYY